MKDDIFRYGVKNEFKPNRGFNKIKKFFSMKMQLSLLSIMFILVILVVIGVMLAKHPTCPVCEQCKECAVCEKCEEGPSCPVVEPEKQIKIVNNYVCSNGSVVAAPEECAESEKYICEDGTTVESAEDCVKTINITTKYQVTDNNVTLAIQDIDYDMKGDDWGTINVVSFTVKNIGSSPILPIIKVYVFNESDDADIKSTLRHTIKINTTLDQGEFVKDTENVHISFSGSNITAKFILTNGLDEAGSAVAVLDRPLYS